MNPELRTIIEVGHSPDADDAFMFYAVTAGKNETGEVGVPPALPRGEHGAAVRADRGLAETAEPGGAPPRDHRHPGDTDHRVSRAEGLHRRNLVCRLLLEKKKETVHELLHQP